MMPDEIGHAVPGGVNRAVLRGSDKQKNLFRLNAKRSTALDAADQAIRS
jgi:hypothetical protein